MVCPECLIQMHQELIDGKPQGYGKSTDEEYFTSEVKVFPDCGLRVLESYSAKVLKPRG